MTRIKGIHMSTFYITTAIDYPNGSPHMGHAYEKIITDFYARWHALKGKEVHFLTGTDENGQKLIQSAKEAGQETLSYVDEQVIKFRALCERLQITNNDFIRTTEDRHIKMAQKFWEDLKASDDIYFGKYSGKYCYSCESFYTELQAPDGNCPHHHKPLELKEEEGYFLKMSKYQDWIIDYIKSNPGFISPARSHKEILARLQAEDLRDLAISRPSEGWGVPVPGDDKFVMYTWFDALINYYAGLNKEQQLEKLWPCDVHVIGKDIAWFHTVIWPIMLKASGRELPKKVYVHGMVLAEDGRKMSKSLNNGVDPNEVMDNYPLDSFKYYLIRAISASADGAFSLKDLAQKHNSELANDFGNLVMRVVKFTLKKIGDELSTEGQEQLVSYDQCFADMDEKILNMEHNRAVDRLWESVNHANAYINEAEPWKIKEDPEKLKTVMANLLYGVHCLAYMLQPICPGAAEKTLNFLGVDKNQSPIGKFTQTYKLTEPEILFTKIELD